jgi:hypothetical protein
MPDMNGVLGRIEALAPGMAASPAGTAMIALYFLWHRNLPSENHRSGASSFLAKYQKALMAPSVTAFVTGLLTGDLPAWSDDQWLALATSRRHERATMKSAQPIPSELDAALLVTAAHVLLAAGQESAAAELAGWAVEEMPGYKPLCAWETSVAPGELPGNAADDGGETRGWILGHFIDSAEGVRSSKDVEVKWGIHPAGEKRAAWTSGDQRTTLVLLVSGHFKVDLEVASFILERQGDYLVWGLESITPGKP